VGHHLIAGVAGSRASIDGSTASFASISDNQGGGANTYQIDLNHPYNDFNNRALLGFASSKLAVASGTFTVSMSVTADGALFTNYTICEVSNLATSVWFDGSAVCDTDASASCTATRGAGNTTNNAFVLALLNGQTDTVAGDPTSGYTSLELNNGGFLIESTAYKILTSTETTSATWTGTTPPTYLVTSGLAVYKGIDSAPPPSDSTSLLTGVN
jgi:hypothetical protein